MVKMSYQQILAACNRCWNWELEWGFLFWTLSCMSLKLSSILVFKHCSASCFKASYHIPTHRTAQHQSNEIIFYNAIKRPAKSRRITGSTRIKCQTSLNRNLIYLTLLISFLLSARAHFTAHSERQINHFFRLILISPPPPSSCVYAKTLMGSCSSSSGVGGKLANIANHKRLVEPGAKWKAPRFELCNLRKRNVETWGW